MERKHKSRLMNTKTIWQIDKQTDKALLILSMIKHVRQNVQLDSHKDKQTDIDTNDGKHIGSFMNRYGR
jgi:hypothetical protein